MSCTEKSLVSGTSGHTRPKLRAQHTSAGCEATFLRWNEILYVVKGCKSG